MAWVWPLNAKSQVVRAVLGSHSGGCDLKLRPFHLPPLCYSFLSEMLRELAADHIKCRRKWSRFLIRSRERGKPWACGWDLVARVPEMSAGIKEWGVLKPLNFTSWRGAVGDREAETQPTTTSGLAQAKLTKVEQQRWKLQILKPSCPAWAVLLLSAGSSLSDGCTWKGLLE